MLSSVNLFRWDLGHLEVAIMREFPSLSSVNLFRWGLGHLEASIMREFPRLEAIVMVNKIIYLSPLNPTP